MTIVVVTGSRSLVSSPARLLIKQHFLTLIRDLGPTEVHHGGAQGPDTWASVEFAGMHVPHRPKPSANRWDAIQALFDRNHSMVETAEMRAKTLNLPCVMVACWDDKSNGTKDAFEFAQSLHVPVVFVPVKLCEAYVACQIARG